MRIGLLLAICIGLGMFCSVVQADDPAVSIADFAAYQAALAPSPASLAATPVTFRDLWDHPEAHRGRPVRVEGRLARLFRQPAVGQFPALTEGWITSPLGEPSCLVFPTGQGRVVPELGARVRFDGTFLRRITYPGGDAARVAPLVVGPAPPTGLDPAAAASSGLGPILGGNPAADWGIGLAAALGVGWILLRRHLAGPPVVASPPIGPAPSFLDGGDSSPDPCRGADDGDD